MAMMALSKRVLRATRATMATSKTTATMQGTSPLIGQGATALIADPLGDKRVVHLVRGRRHDLPQSARAERADRVIGHRSKQSWNTTK